MPSGDNLPSLAPLAQLAEQLTLNQRVVGSSPTRRTKTFVLDLVRRRRCGHVFAGFAMWFTVSEWQETTEAALFCGLP